MSYFFLKNNKRKTITFLIIFIFSKSRSSLSWPSPLREPGPQTVPHSGPHYGPQLRRVPKAAVPEPEPGSERGRIRPERPRNPYDPRQQLLQERSEAQGPSPRR